MLSRRKKKRLIGAVLSTIDDKKNTHTQATLTNSHGKQFTRDDEGKNLENR